MARHLYSFALFLFTPILIGYVIIKYRREGARADILARLGLKTPPKQQNSVWIHACSLGEAKVAVQLADAMLSSEPNLVIQFTATTPAGVNFLISENRLVAIFPWDFGWIWKRWIQAMKPRVLVIIETELWPNLIHVCRMTNTPVVLANGRLSQKSFRNYRKYSVISKPMWETINPALMQAKNDANRAHQLGVSLSALSEVGSIKLDQEIMPTDSSLASQLKSWKGERQLVCLMSSHPEDDEKVLEVFAQACQLFLALLIVPRHPTRGTEILKSATNLNLETAAVSTGVSKSRVLIGDTFGQMSTYLDAADVVIIGGSFSGKGGQNPIEAALLKKPMISGPSMFNFQNIADGLIDCGGLVRIQPHQLLDAIHTVGVHSQIMGEAAFAWVNENKGSTQLQAAAVLAAADLLPVK